MRHLLSAGDLSREQVLALFELAADLKTVQREVESGISSKAPLALRLQEHWRALQDRTLGEWLLPAGIVVVVLAVVLSFFFARSGSSSGAAAGSDPPIATGVAAPKFVAGAIAAT